MKINNVILFYHQHHLKSSSNYLKHNWFDKSKLRFLNHYFTARRSSHNTVFQCAFTLNKGRELLKGCILNNGREL